MVGEPIFGLDRGGGNTSRISRFHFQPRINSHIAGAEIEHQDSLAVSSCVFTDEDLVS